MVTLSLEERLEERLEESDKMEECHCEPECFECQSLIRKIRRLEELLQLEQDEANHRSEEADDYRKKFYEAKGWDK